MKAGWRSKPFDDCIEKITYTTKIQRKEFMVAGAFPVVSQEEALINGYWNNADDVYWVETPLVVFGDHTKVLKYVDFDFVLGADGVKLLLPKEFLIPKFFFYQLQIAKLDSLGYARHYKLLKGLEIKYPDKAEQHRIVAILDEAFDGIAIAEANAEKNLQNARALFDSYLDQVFQSRVGEWKTKTLEEVVDSGCSLSYGIVQPGDEYPNGVPVVRPTDLGAKIISRDGLKRVDPILTNSYRRTTLRGRDLLLCVRGSTGVVSFAADDLIGSNVTRGIVPIYFDSRVVSQEFGYYLIKSDFVQTQIREKTYGAALMQINIRDLRLLSLPIPPLEQQTVLAATCDQLQRESQRLQTIYQKKLAALDELKKSLLHQAFSGAL